MTDGRLNTFYTGLILVFLFLFSSMINSYQPRLPMTKIPIGAWFRYPEGDPDTSAAWLYYRPQSYNFGNNKKRRSGFQIFQNGRLAFFYRGATLPKDTIWAKWKITKPGELEIIGAPTALKKMHWLWKDPDLIFVYLH